MQKSRKHVSGHKKTYSRSKQIPIDSTQTKDNKPNVKLKSKRRNHRNSMRNLKTGKLKNKESAKTKKQISILTNNRKQMKARLNSTLGGYELETQKGHSRKMSYKNKGMRTTHSGNKLGGLTYDKNKLITSSLLRGKEQVHLYDKRRTQTKNFESERTTGKDWNKMSRMPVKKNSKKSPLYGTLDRRNRNNSEKNSIKNSRLSVESNVKSKVGNRKKQESLRRFQKNKKTNLTIYNKKDDVIGRKNKVMSQRNILTSMNKLGMDTKPISTRGRVKVGRIPIGSFHRKNRSFIGTESKKLVENLEKKQKKSGKQKIEKKVYKDPVLPDNGIFYTKERLTAPVLRDNDKLEVLNVVPKSKFYWKS
jgi:hypothetical protein